MYMHVNTDAFVAIPRRAHTQVCHFRTHPRQGSESFNGIRYVGVVLVPQYLCHSFDVACLIVVKSNFDDEFIEQFWQDGQYGLECQTLRRSI